MVWVQQIIFDSRDLTINVCKGDREAALEVGGCKKLKFL